MTHQWENDPTGSTPTDVLFRCQQPGCGAIVGFNRPGVGEPSATEAAVPESINEYTGPCAADETVTPAVIENLRVRVERLEKKR